MKQLLQTIAVYVFGLDALQLLVALSCVILFMQIVVNKFLSGTWWKERKKNRETKNELWNIE